MFAERIRPHLRSYRALAWGLSALVGLTALVRALTGSAPPAPVPADQATRLAAFQTIAQAEPTLWAQAQSHFPGDAWSQDDDFHALEMQRARRFADLHKVSLGDVLRAIDDGMRENWTRPNPQTPLRATVAPCRPRPVY